jgi:hypothetical protein
MASSADNYRGAPDPSARHASEISPITAADMQGPTGWPACDRGSHGFNCDAGGLRARFLIFTV